MCDSAVLLIIADRVQGVYPVSQVGVCPVILVKAVLPLDHHAQVLVVQDEHLDVQLLNEGCGQLLAVHKKAAVTINVHHHLHDDQNRIRTLPPAKFESTASCRV